MSSIGVRNQCGKSLGSSFTKLTYYKFLKNEECENFLNWCRKENQWQNMWLSSIIWSDTVHISSAQIRSVPGNLSEV